MKLTEYLAVSAEALQDYINNGLVDTTFHPKFPLVIFTYSRKCVSEQAWDSVTTKCRGLIANTETDEVIARPFEKFFNYGDPQAGLQLAAGGTLEEPAPGNACIFHEPDTLYEKMDGFLCTMYRWAGKEYLASKGSFDSPHAKWATAIYNQMLPAGGTWPIGYTPVFEGITKNLRIVVDYGEREELVLIGLVNIKTGEELSHASLMTWATANGFNIPETFTMSLATAAETVLDSRIKNVEGYVAYWFRLGQTPFRLKIKYQDYLRVHRLVTGVSPRRVYEALVNGWQSELDEWTDESTPWFKHFIHKWHAVLNTRYQEITHGAEASYGVIQGVLNQQWQSTGSIPVRKDWALLIQRSEFVQYAPVLFAMLDGKNVQPIIWKMVKPLISGSKPMIDATKM